MSYLHPDDQDVVGALPSDRRTAIIEDIYTDLLAFGEAQGYNASTLTGAIENLFRTFATEFYTYTLIGSRDLAAAIDNNVTLAWLNTDAGGKTIRERIVSRLS